MKTGMGIEIRAEDLTHYFIWGRKKVKIGKFDPSSYPEMAQEDIKEMSQDIFDQLEDSEELSEAEMAVICNLVDDNFNKCIKRIK